MSRDFRAVLGNGEKCNLIVPFFFYDESFETQSTGFLVTLSKFASSVSGSGSCMYSHRASVGSDMRIDSTLDPGV